MWYIITSAIFYWSSPDQPWYSVKGDYTGCEHQEVETMRGYLVDWLQSYFTEKMEQLKENFPNSNHYLTQLPVYSLLTWLLLKWAFPLAI